jgi:uncharacterized membrane protein
MDGVWLGLLAKDSYTEALGGMLRDSYPTLPWLVFYCLYSLAAVHLVVIKNLSNSKKSVLFDGAVLGLAAYGAYNLTNYAILANWPLGITLMDWAWGTSVTALSSLAGWSGVRYFTAHNR